MITSSTKLGSEPSTMKALDGQSPPQPVQGEGVEYESTKSIVGR